jgi:parvulin-like peptidyl-prolyl isomerase
MAEMYSEDGTRETGGDWGWIEKGTLNEDLTKAAFKLKAGEISPLVELGGNFYIITVEARKNSTTRPLAELRPEIEKELLQEERIKQMDKWVDTLRAKAFIKMF